MQSTPSSSARIVMVAANTLGAVAGTALTVMMFLMAVDVVCRYFFNSPVPGGLELVEYLMAVIVPLSIAYCQSRRSHIGVDLVMDLCPKTMQRVVNYIVKLLTIGFIALISWQNCAYITETYRSGLTSAVLKIPAYPFVLTVAAGMLAFMLILIIHLFARKPKEKTDGTH